MGAGGVLTRRERARYVGVDDGVLPVTVLVVTLGVARLIPLVRV